MQTLINWTRSPIVVVDESGSRITLRPGKGVSVSGEFSEHPWVKKGRIEVAEGQSADRSDQVPDNELDTLRKQFENIFGKPPHKNAGKAKIQQEIDKWREAAD